MRVPRCPYRFGESNEAMRTGGSWIFTGESKTALACITLPVEVEVFRMPTAASVGYSSLGNGARAQNKFCIRQLSLVVESQLYTTGALVSFDAYTIGKLPNHKGR